MLTQHKTILKTCPVIYSNSFFNIFLLKRLLFEWLIFDFSSLLTWVIYFTALAQTPSFFKISRRITTTTHIRSKAIFNRFVYVMRHNIWFDVRLSICEVLGPLTKFIPKGLTRCVLDSVTLILLFNRRFGKPLTILFLSWGAHLFNLFTEFDQLIEVVDVLFKFSGIFQFAHLRGTLVPPCLSVNYSFIRAQSVIFLLVEMYR